MHEGAVQCATVKAHKPTTAYDKKQLHVIDSVGASLLPTVADGSNVFFMIDAEEVDGAKDIFVLIGRPNLKGRAAPVVGLRPDLFFFSALGERGDGLLPGRFGRVGLRCPDGGRK